MPDTLKSLPKSGSRKLKFLPGLADSIDMGALKNFEPQVRPSIFRHHDIHEFLDEYLKYMASLDKRFSYRKLAEKLKMNHTHLTRVVRGYVSMTPSFQKRLLSELNLNAEETSFFDALRELSEAKSQPLRVQAFKRVLRYKRFKEEFKSDIVEHEYLSKWYYPVVRELTKLPNFKADAKWIRSQLDARVTASEAQSALNFLLRHNYIEQSPDGKIKPATKQITCAGGIYRLAASEYHEQLLEIARDSIHEVDRDLREISAHTMAMPKQNIAEVKAIIDDALEKIRNLPLEDDDKDSVFQLSFLAFPVTKTSGKSGGDK